VCQCQKAFSTVLTVSLELQRVAAILEFILPTLPETADELLHISVQ
jgi:hypothetical protein